MRVSAQDKLGYANGASSSPSGAVTITLESGVRIMREPEPTGPHVNPAPESCTAEYRGLTLRSVFQPIASLAHGQVVGYEALLRATDAVGQPISPLVVFDEAADVGELIALDRVVCELHIKSFRAQDPGNCWLFINVNTLAFTSVFEGEDNLQAVAEKYGMPPSRIVVEVLEKDILDDEAFNHSLIKCKKAGFMVAIDDFGKGLSNFDRIFNFAPSIVKFDLSLVALGRFNPKMQRAYVHLTALLHEIGAMVLAEGIESIDDAYFMIAANVDFLQGYWVARPDASTAAPLVPQRVLDLRRGYDAHARATDASQHDKRADYEAVLAQAAQFFEETGSITQASRAFLATPNANRLFVLDEEGQDIGEEMVSGAGPDAQLREKLAPLQTTRNSSFIHRSYFRDALRFPDRAHFLSPLFSFVDAKTLSLVAKAVRRNGRMFVVCGTFTPG